MILTQAHDGARPEGAVSQSVDVLVGSKRPSATTVHSALLSDCSGSIIRTLRVEAHLCTYDRICG